MPADPIINVIAGYLADHHGLDMLNITDDFISGIRMGGRAKPRIKIKFRGDKIDVELIGWAEITEHQIELNDPTALEQLDGLVDKCFTRHS